MGPALVVCQSLSVSLFHVVPNVGNRFRFASPITCGINLPHQPTVNNRFPAIRSNNDFGTPATPALQAGAASFGGGTFMGQRISSPGTSMGSMGGWTARRACWSSKICRGGQPLKANLSIVLQLWIRYQRSSRILKSLMIGHPLKMRFAQRCSATRLRWGHQTPLQYGTGPTASERRSSSESTGKRAFCKALPSVVWKWKAENPPCIATRLLGWVTVQRFPDITCLAYRGGASPSWKAVGFAGQRMSPGASGVILRICGRWHGDTVTLLAHETNHRIVTQWM